MRRIASSRHIAFSVADVDAAWQTLKENGCEHLTDPLTAPNGNFKLVFTQDSDGNWLEIMQMVPNQEIEGD